MRELLNIIMEKGSTEPIELDDLNPEVPDTNAPDADTVSNNVPIVPQKTTPTAHITLVTSQNYSWAWL
jgi:hypothetical protein